MFALHLLQTAVCSSLGSTERLTLLFALRPAVNNKIKNTRTRGAEFYRLPVARARTLHKLTLADKYTETNCMHESVIHLFAGNLHRPLTVFFQPTNYTRGCLFQLFIFNLHAGAAVYGLVACTSWRIYARAEWIINSLHFNALRANRLMCFASAILCFKSHNGHTRRGLSLFHWGRVRWNISLWNKLRNRPQNKVSLSAESDYLLLCALASCAQKHTHV